MNIAIVGGKLQGVEACFLARAAGWKVTLIDRNSDVPAKGLCDSFHAFDVTKDAAFLSRVVETVDLMVPALEDVKALMALQECAATTGVPLAYDEKAHAISRSKKRSNRFFERIGVPAPRPWPGCGWPVMAKPSGLSGSRGVTKLVTEEEFTAFSRNKRLGRWVIQEYLGGPSYSLEVLGLNGAYEVLQVTELEMDGQYDCKRVLAPAKISAGLEQEFREITRALAKGLGLTGIMDVEVIHHSGRLKVLEIDARLPSQTPTAVLASTGINMLEVLGKIFVEKSLPGQIMPRETRGVVYEHVLVSETGVEVLGEHVMARSGSLRRIDGFFGADVALTNFDEARSPWGATLIITGENREAAWLRRCQVIRNIESALKERLPQRHVRDHA